jgi:hypothetical protein
MEAFENAQSERPPLQDSVTGAEMLIFLETYANRCRRTKVIIRERSMVAAETP